MERRKAIMVDVDGTICLKGDRNIYNLTLVGEDLPNLPVIAAGVSHVPQSPITGDCGP
jgi:hypothetical protein